MVDIDTGIANIKNLISGVYWVGLAGIILYLVSMMSNVYRVLFISFVLVVLSLSVDKPNLFMDTCTNHSTATACANWGQCELVDKSFAIDKEWAVLQRNVCMEGMPADKTRLLNSYDPARCGAWGDCSSACVDKLTDIKSQIENVSCGKKFEDGVTLEEVADEFPLSASTFLDLFPFNNVDGFWRIWAGFGIAICTGLMLVRTAKMFMVPVP